MLIRRFSEKKAGFKEKRLVFDAGSDAARAVAQAKEKASQVTTAARETGAIMHKAKVAAESAGKRAEVVAAVTETGPEQAKKKAEEGKDQAKELGSMQLDEFRRMFLGEYEKLKGIMDGKKISGEWGMDNLSGELNVLNKDAIFKQIEHALQENPDDLKALQEFVTKSKKIVVLNFVPDMARFIGGSVIEKLQNRLKTDFAYVREFGPFKSGQAKLTYEIVYNQMNPTEELKFSDPALNDEYRNFDNEKEKTEGKGQKAKDQITIDRDAKIRKLKESKGAKILSMMFGAEKDPTTNKDVFEQVVDGENWLAMLILGFFGYEEGKDAFESVVSMFPVDSQESLRNLSKSATESRAGAAFKDEAKAAAAAEAEKKGYPRIDLDSLINNGKDLPAGGCVLDKDCTIKEGTVLKLDMTAANAAVILSEESNIKIEGNKDKDWGEDKGKGTVTLNIENSGEDKVLTIDSGIFKKDTIFKNVKKIVEPEATA